MKFKIIKTNCGREFKVDPELYEELSKHRWYFRKMKTRNGDRGYAYRGVHGDGKSTTAYMHRDVMGAGVGQIVDHINRDPSDNRLANLRFVTSAQNAQNQRPRKTLFQLVKEAEQLAWDVRGASRARAELVALQD